MEYNQKLQQMLQAEEIQPQIASRVQAFMNLAGCSLEQALLKLDTINSLNNDYDFDFKSLDCTQKDKTFKNYVSCSQNEFPLELARKIVVDEEFGQKYNPLYIYAAVGLGKTHLMSAISNSIRKKRGSKVLLTNSVDFELELDKALRMNRWHQFRNYLKSMNLIMIDDIQLCEHREDVQREIFALINHMVEANKVVVISSDVPPTRLTGMEQRLISRLGGGVIVSLSMGNKEFREKILLKAFPELKKHPVILGYISGKIADNVRAMLAAAKTALALGNSFSEEQVLGRLNEIYDLPLYRKDIQTGSLAEKEKSSSEKTDIQQQQQTQSRNQKNKFKEMLARAETEDEYIMAVQIAINTKLKELRQQNAASVKIKKYEQALKLVQKKELDKVLKMIDL